MNKMVVFFPTNNIGKFDRYRIAITGRGIKYTRYLQLPNGDDCILNVPEDKATPRENAEAKAIAYYEEYKKYIKGDFAIITTDESLFFNGVDDEQQPGMFVRRFNGIKGRASDEEVVERYTDFVRSLGGTAKARWAYSLVMYNGTDFSYMDWEEPVTFSDTPHYPITPGYVLNNITIVGTDEKRKNDYAFRPN